MLFLVLISGMFFPPQTILIPLFKMFNRLGLLDTLSPMIITHTAMGIPICTLMTPNFFTTVPSALACHVFDAQCRTLSAALCSSFRCTAK